MAYNYQSPFFNANPMIPNTYMPQPQYGGNMPSYAAQGANMPQTMQNPSTGANQPEQLINGGFIVLPSEEDIKKYPIAPGNLVTFKIENKPVIIEKSMGRSPFDAPHYERYKLIREEMEEEKPEPAKSEPDELEAIKNELETLKGNYKELKESFSEIEKLIKTSPKKKPREKEEIEEDAV